MNTCRKTGCRDALGCFAVASADPHFHPEDKNCTHVCPREDHKADLPYSHGDHDEVSTPVHVVVKAAENHH